jgi:myo-inositol-1(or 4)-monophosphatase
VKNLLFENARISRYARNDMLNSAKENMNQRLVIAKNAARAAGKVIKEKLADTREIHFKGKRDIVTDADHAADQIIHQMIHERFPNDQFISEEGDASQRKELWARAAKSNDENLWVIDPLDGTTNYAHRLPTFCVSIALYQANAVQIGVVYDPLRDELFSTERGKGAFLNGKPIHVSGVDRFMDAVIAGDWSRSPQVRRKTAAIYSQVLVRCMSARALGSAALALCYIAAGRLDGYFHLSLASWDMAAGALLIEEAGGQVTTPTNVPWSVHSKSYVATNGILHHELLKYFKS